MRHLIAAVLFLCAAPAAARKEASWTSDEQEQPANYWQLNYGIPQNAVTYNITLESAALEETERAVRKLAEAQGLRNVSPQSVFGGGANARSLSFSMTVEEAEAFSEKAITAAKLKQFSTYNSLNASLLSEVKKKAERIEDELKKHGSDLEDMPIAGSLIRDLHNRYQNYISAYEANKNKAVVVVTIILKPKR